MNLCAEPVVLVPTPAVAADLRHDLRSYRAAEVRPNLPRLHQPLLGPTELVDFEPDEVRQQTEAVHVVEVVAEANGPGFGRTARGSGQGLEQVRSATLAHGGGLEVDGGSASGTRVHLRPSLAHGVAP